jgi:hypothetical protein
MQEYEQLGHVNQINEDASGMEEELSFSYTSCGFEEFQQCNMPLCCF